MEVLYKAQIFFYFAIPAIFAIAFAEWFKELSLPAKIVLYGLGFISTVFSLVIPFVK